MTEQKPTMEEKTVTAVRKLFSLGQSSWSLASGSSRDLKFLGIGFVLGALFFSPGGFFYGIGMFCLGAFTTYSLSKND